MDWFAKPYGPGDIDGAGTLKLLGSPALDLTELFVRETAQNSWDARLPSSDLSYTIHLRSLASSELEVLRSALGSGASRLPLAASLAKKNLMVLEVSDRGTWGLTGPTRNDVVIPPGVSRNYIDLVLNVGAPPDALGAGTYGFGKTVAFTASRAQTAVYWTRAREPHGLEHRLIACGIGDNFEINRQRYTGRHWWGVQADNQRIEPLKGPMAQRLGERFFRARYGPNESGTSIMIIDPILTEGTPLQMMEAIRNKVVEHLWPKLVPDHRRPNMAINLRFEDIEVEIPKPETIPFLQPFVDCLRAVRAQQSGETPQSQFNVKVHALKTQRPAETVGHLALTKAPISLGQPSGLTPPAHHVCYMRHEAELVVKYQEFPVLDVDGFHWAGVFKCTPQVEEFFAEAEPPAHDDWQPKLLPRPGSTYVNQALGKTRAAVTDFLRPFQPLANTTGETPSAAALADRLAGLLGTACGTRPLSTGKAAKTRRPSRPRVVKPRARVIDVQTLTREGTFRHMAALIELDAGSATAARIHAMVSVGVDGAREHDPDVARVIGWSDHPTGALFEDNEFCYLPPGGNAWLRIMARHDLAVDVQLGVEAI
ncbi:hypothetical protein [Enemella sp. A6]|uniref:hypothetical protein n=1 Tax=Enemella sp. A6 TaxID=3440152 RepID=UPI003EB91CC1